MDVDVIGKRNDGVRERNLESFLLYCIFAATISTCLNLVLKFGIRIRPFDLLLLVSGPLLLLTAQTRMRFTLGFSFYAVYAIFNAILAFKLGSGNGIRETVQSLEILLYASIIARYLDQIDWKKVGILFCISMFIIMSYNVAWHVANGYMSGWKLLNEPKFAFLYFQVSLFLYLYICERQLSLLEALGLMILFVVLLQSGERKALMVFIVYMSFMVALGRTKIITLAAVLPVIFVAGMFLAASDGYVDRQIRSIINHVTTENKTLSIDEFIVEDYETQTLSNAQRTFANRVTEEIQDEYFWFGVGTNGYLEFVLDNYGDLPEYLLLGIHNEFQRARAEGELLATRYFYSHGYVSSIS